MLRGGLYFEAFYLVLEYNILTKLSMAFWW